MGEVTPQPGVIYYLDDHLGSAHIVTDSLGNVLHEENRYPYGLEKAADTADNEAVEVDYVYTGKELDEETGLIYFGKRYYNPEMGRWISPDPLFVEEPKIAIEKTASSNLYTYVRDNPMTYVDPDGLIDNAALHENRLVYHDQYQENLRVGPRSPEERVLEMSLGVGLLTLAAAPIALHAGVALAPYTASAELAAGRAAYTATSLVAEKTAAGVGYAISVGDAAAETMLTTAAEVAVQGVAGYALTHPEQSAAFVGGVAGSIVDPNFPLFPNNDPSIVMFDYLGSELGKGLREIYDDAQSSVNEFRLTSESLIK